MRRFCLGLLSVFLCLGLLGSLACTLGSAPSSPAIASAGGHYLPKSSAILPTTAPPAKALLTLSGTPYTVGVRSSLKQSEFVIELTKGNQELDRELYSNDWDGFRMREVGGEVYNPPIDLLRFPMKVGDSWTWDGHLGSGLKADATVTTAEDTVFVSAAPHTCVRVQVALRFLAVGGEDHATRTLTFWFSPKHGLFKRQYDNLSVREPAP